MMASDLELNRDLILYQERQVARQVAGQVVDRPVLAMWMIVIPIFFVFYYFQLKRYKSSLREFSQNFLITRQRTLEAVYEATSERTEVDVNKLVEMSDSPAEVKGQYRLWLEALVDHFQALIQASGSSYEELVTGAYRKKTNYLLALNHLTRVENDFNRALIAYLPGDQQDITQVVDAMGKSVKEIRRSQASAIFS
ncbi:MAG: NF038143 family protein [Desulfocapsaceae bacterium]